MLLLEVTMFKIDEQKLLVNIVVETCRKRSRDEILSDKNGDESKEVCEFEVLYKIKRLVKFGEEVVEELINQKSKSFIQLPKGEQWVEAKEYVMRDKDGGSAKYYYRFLSKQENAKHIVESSDKVSK